MTLRTAGTLRRRVNKTNPKAPKRRKEGGNILPTLYNPLALPLLWKPQETEQLSVYPGCLPTPAAEAATLPAFAFPEHTRQSLLPCFPGCPGVITPDIHHSFSTIPPSDPSMPPGADPDSAPWEACTPRDRGPSLLMPGC